MSIRVLLLSLLALAGCTHPASGGDATEEDAPVIGAADYGDRADRRCTIVTREAWRRFDEAGEPEQICSGGECFDAWSITVDVARDAATTSPDVGLLYRLASDPDARWYATRSSSLLGGDERYVRHEITFGRHLVRAGDSFDGAEIELVPYLRTSDGRLFDKNRMRGDFDNYWLTEGNGWRIADDGACAGAGSHATIAFGDDWSEQVEGELVTNGRVTLDYDAERLTACRGTHNGHRAWDIAAHVIFHPGDQHQSASVVSAPGTFYVPAGAEAMEVWFVNTSIDCRGEGAYDSALGENYHFAIER